nr:hypothetical protein [Ktedonobacteraceae bacterium]
MSGQRFFRPGIRIQLTLWYTLVSAVLIVIFGIVFYTFSERMLASSFDTILQLRAQQVAEGVTVSNGKIRVDDVVNELPELDASSALIDVAGSDNLPDANNHT